MNQKTARKNPYTYRTNRDVPVLGEKRMTEETTQGINTKTTIEDTYNTNKKPNETELLDLRAGYTNSPAP